MRRRQTNQLAAVEHEEGTRFLKWKLDGEGRRRSTFEQSSSSFLSYELNI